MIRSLTNKKGGTVSQFKRLSENSFGKYKFTLQDEIDLAEQTANWYKDKSQKKDKLIETIKRKLESNTESKSLLNLIIKIEEKYCI